MSEIFPKDLLLRCGGRTWLRHGCLAVAGARKGLVEVPVTFSRADASTCATYIDQDGIVRLAAANVPRIEYPPALSGLVDQFGYPYCGPSLEGGRSQAWQFTEDLTNAVWAKTNCTISANADGNADGIVTNVGAVNCNVGQPTGALTDNTQQSHFFEVKAGNKTWARISSQDKASVVRNSWVNLSTGAVGTKDANHTLVVTKVGSYYRIAVMWPSASGGGTTIGYICPADADNNVNTTGDGATINIYVRTSQMEVDKAFPSSYIPRLGAGAVTRAADSLTIPWNYGPMDVTVLIRSARAVWADVAGAITVSPGFFAISTSDSTWALETDNNSRVVQARIKPNGAANVTASTAILAGAEQRWIAQYDRMTSGARCLVDVGGGPTGFTAESAAHSTFGNQILRIGRYNDDAYAVLLDAIFVRGQRTFAEMLAIP